MKKIIFKCPEHDWATTDAGQYCPNYHGFRSGRESIPNRVRHPQKERHEVVINNTTLVHKPKPKREQ